MNSNKMEQEIEPMNILTLPIEILMIIMSYLPFDDIANFLRTCRTVQQITYFNCFWRELCIDRFNTKDIELAALQRIQGDYYFNICSTLRRYHKKPHFQKIRTEHIKDYIVLVPYFMVAKYMNLPMIDNILDKPVYIRIRNDQYSGHSDIIKTFSQVDSITFCVKSTEELEKIGDAQLFGNIDKLETLEILTFNNKDTSDINDNFIFLTFHMKHNNFFKSRLNNYRKTLGLSFFQEIEHRYQIIYN